MSPLCLSFFRTKSRTVDHHASTYYTEKLGAEKSFGVLESSSTLVRSPSCKNEDGTGMVDTSDRISSLRDLMRQDTLDYYIVPTDDAHGSEYVSPIDKRRQWLSGFTGSQGVAIVTARAAYLITDSRYWIQARTELDHNWQLVKAGSVDGPKDWVDWLLHSVDHSRVGIDAKLIAHTKATSLITQLAKSSSVLVFPENYVDRIWTNKPSASHEPVYIHEKKFAGVEADVKLASLRDWIVKQDPSGPDAHKQVATLISSLACIAWLLNLRGADIAFNPVFHSYLFVGLNETILFIEPVKINTSVNKYLKSIGVEHRPYDDVWSFLPSLEHRIQGNVILCDTTPYAISLLLDTHYAILPAVVEEMKAVKNEVELEGLRRAYRRDGAAYVRWLAWLDKEMEQGHQVTEYQAAERLTKFRETNKYFAGLAYENISGSGPNGALPHYSPDKETARVIDYNTPYVNDSGGQYKDGTIDTTRTMHFGTPTPEQCDAYTRVLQGHISIDSAIFPEGTSGAQLDAFARRSLWQAGLNYLHGSGHGFGSFLNVHEGPQSFSARVPLVPGHVITNEPGFYAEGKWGMRIESALIVHRVKTENQFNDDIWLGFERLTCVPIQTTMVVDSLLTNAERQWLMDHNKRCFKILEPLLRDDKLAHCWLWNMQEANGVKRCEVPPCILL